MSDERPERKSSEVARVYQNLRVLVTRRIHKRRNFFAVLIMYLLFMAFTWLLVRTGGYYFYLFGITGSILGFLVVGAEAIELMLFEAEQREMRAGHQRVLEARALKLEQLQQAAKEAEVRLVMLNDDGELVDADEVLFN